MCVLNKLRYALYAYLEVFSKLETVTALTLLASIAQRLQVEYLSTGSTLPKSDLSVKVCELQLFTCFFVFL